MITKEWKAQAVDILKTIPPIIKELIDLQTHFPEVHIYFDATEPDPSILVEIDYDSLSKEERDFLFGFGYRLNKAFRSALGNESFFVEVTILNRVDNKEHMTKII